MPGVNICFSTFPLLFKRHSGISTTKHCIKSQCISDCRHRLGHFSRAVVSAGVRMGIGGDWTCHPSIRPSVHPSIPTTNSGRKNSPLRRRNLEQDQQSLQCFSSEKTSRDCCNVSSRTDIGQKLLQDTHRDSRL